jgi:Fe-S-cluster containining protein
MSSDHTQSTEIFKCQKCGDCCKGYGGTFLTSKDIRDITRYIKTDPQSFVADYCQMSGGKPILSQAINGYCIFWDKQCLIHPVKPRMCKAWPFLKSVLIDVKNWDIMAASCPGIRPDVPDSVIRECVRKEMQKR